MSLMLGALLLRGPLPGFAQSAVPLPNPILFVTQVPVPGDFTSIGSVFGNQQGSAQSVARGGDLWIRYGDGSLKNLTQSAGYGVSGLQGASSIAVREPSVHWSGTKALFSMVVGGATRQFEVGQYYFQIYEITGLGPSDTPVITKVPNQPANYNNVSPIYGTDERIIFTSDRPRNGDRALYPQRDEYEEAPTVTGLWSLNPSTGDLFMIQHSPSGSFSPQIDSFGRVVYIRWDHLQRDQQADGDATGGDDYGTFNYSDESPTAARLNNRTEIFPEPRASRTDLLAGTNLAGHSFNDFFPWMINEDGTEEETVNHLGRHEFHGYFDRSLTDDPNLTYHSSATPRTNPNEIENFIQIKEDPAAPGNYFGIDAPEFSTHASGQIVKFNAPPGFNPDQTVITYVTHRDTHTYTDTPSVNDSGLYRNPLPLSNGTVVTVHTSETRSDTNTGTRANPGSRYAFRLKTISLSGSWYVAGADADTGHFQIGHMVRPGRAGHLLRPALGARSGRGAGADEAVARRDANDDGRAAGVRTTERERRNDAELPATAGARDDRRPQRHDARPFGQAAAVQPSRRRHRHANARRRRQDLRRLASAALPGRSDSRARRHGRSVARPPRDRAIPARPCRRESATERCASRPRSRWVRTDRSRRSCPRGGPCRGSSPARTARRSCASAIGSRCSLARFASAPRATASTRATRPTSRRRRISPKRCDSC